MPSGRIWIATNAGLSRYSNRRGEWIYYTRADGLPSDDIQCLAFDRAGNIIVGTQCDGLALAQAAQGYRQWRSVKGPSSLPSDMVNDVLVTRQGLLFVATTAGLARSEDSGRTWRVLRASSPALPAESWSSQDRASVLQPFSRHLLRQDYVSCLAQDGGGALWIGYRERGYEVRDARAIRPLAAPSDDTAARTGFVRAFLPQSNGSALVGYYGEGHQLAVDGARFLSEPLPSVPTVAAMPNPARAPSQGQLRNWASQLAAAPVPAERTRVVELSDDWRTQGTWLGRYGLYWACLSAMVSPDDLIWGAGSQNVRYHAGIGPNHSGDDSLRYWIQWLYTDSREALEMPPTFWDSRLSLGLAEPGKPRREAEWDDHGETYPMSLDGPHLYCTLKIPAGDFVLSLYDFNKDGHSGPNRWRDYRVSIRDHDPERTLDDRDDFPFRPELAHARIHDFRGGVWKRFQVRGPLEITVEVNRNHSYNTLLASVMLDSIEQRPAPYFAPKQVVLSSPKQAVASQRLLQVLEERQGSDAAWHARSSRFYYLALLRFYQAAHGAKQGAPDAARCLSMAACAHRLGLRDDEETYLRLAGATPARDIERALRWDGSPLISGRGQESVSSYWQRQRSGAATVSLGGPAEAAREKMESR